MNEDILQVIKDLTNRLNKLQTENQLLREDIKVLRGEMDMLWEDQRDTFEMVSLLIQERG